jgi:hypothetical protein
MCTGRVFFVAKVLTFKWSLLMIFLMVPSVSVCANLVSEVFGRLLKM